MEGDETSDRAVGGHDRSRPDRHQAHDRAEEGDARQSSSSGATNRIVPALSSGPKRSAASQPLGDRLLAPGGIPLGGAARLVGRGVFGSERGIELRPLVDLLAEIVFEAAQQSLEALEKGGCVDHSFSGLPPLAPLPDPFRLFPIEARPAGSAGVSPADCRRLSIGRSRRDACAPSEGEPGGSGYFCHRLWQILVSATLVRKCHRLWHSNVGPIRPSAIEPFQGSKSCCARNPGRCCACPGLWDRTPLGFGGCVDHPWAPVRWRFFSHPSGILAHCPGVITGTGFPSSTGSSS